MAHATSADVTLPEVLARSGSRTVQSRAVAALHASRWRVVLRGCMSQRDNAMQQRQCCRESWKNTCTITMFPPASTDRIQLLHSMCSISYLPKGCHRQLNIQQLHCRSAQLPPAVRCAQSRCRCPSLLQAVQLDCSSKPAAAEPPADVLPLSVQSLEALRYIHAATACQANI
jgi:hypothetical protein